MFRLMANSLTVLCPRLQYRTACWKVMSSGCHRSCSMDEAMKKQSDIPKFLPSLMK